MWWQAAVVFLAGITLGFGSCAALYRSSRGRSDSVADAQPASAVAETSPSDAAASSVLPEPLQTVIASLPGIVIVVDRYGTVLMASQSALSLRLIRRDRVAFVDIVACATETLRRGTTQESDITLRRPPMRKGMLELRVRGILLPNQHVLLLMDDLTEEHRVAAVRRDFIANVSHELKTPVGAVSLLSEAIVAARDNPETVEHFANRMQLEAVRLTALINDVIDLSRLQGDDPMSHAAVVPVDSIVSAAVDYIKAAAEAKNIEVVIGGRPGELVFGDAGQLQTALRNVLANAVVYSDPNTRVAIAVRENDDFVEIDVKDQGIGIPENELDRIFERFYRVDEARSRVTGGTGLGLSIVRNVCHNHGGDVSVWSVEGEGSTFTLQLPKYSALADEIYATNREEKP